MAALGVALALVLELARGRAPDLPAGAGHDLRRRGGVRLAARPAARATCRSRRSSASCSPPRRRRCSWCSRRAPSGPEHLKETLVGIAVHRRRRGTCSMTADRCTPAIGVVHFVLRRPFFEITNDPRRGAQRRGPAAVLVGLPVLRHVRLGGHLVRADRGRAAGVRLPGDPGGGGPDGHLAHRARRWRSAGASASWPAWSGCWARCVRPAGGAEHPGDADRLLIVLGAGLSIRGAMQREVA